MNQPKIRVEHILFTTAFLLALVTRLANVGSAPLNNAEADLALQSLALARGQNMLIGAQPVYLLLTTLWLYLFPSSNWVARFWPAVAGSLLALSPLLFRKWLGKGPAVILAFALALDPGLLAVSRRADGLALAITFAVFALGFWLNEKRNLAGICAGLALLGGPQIWPGIVALAAALWLVYGRSSQRMSESLADPSSPAVESAGSAPEEIKTPVKTAVLIMLATLFFAGTLFFAVPSGLSAMADTLPAYLRTWAQPSGMSVGLLLVTLLVYEFFPLIWGLIGAAVGLGRKDPVDLFLLVWWAIALVLALANPGHLATDLAWSLLPLWALAARQLFWLVRLPSVDRWPLVGQMVLSAIIICVISMDLVSQANNPNLSEREAALRLIGALVMLVASTGLIAWGWSGQVALRGLAIGASAVLLVYTLSAGWNAAGLSGRRSQETWAPGLALEDADLLKRTFSDLSQWGPNQPGGPDVVVVKNASPALRWLLRGVQRISFVDQLSTGSSPSIVITPNQKDLALAASYRGENFLLSDAVQWGALSRADWFRWVAFRTVPSSMLVQEKIIFWARADMFPGGKLTGSVTSSDSSTQNQPPATK